MAHLLKDQSYVDKNGLNFKLKLIVDEYLMKIKSFFSKSAGNFSALHSELA